MRRGELILLVGPRLLHVGKGYPRGVVLGLLRLRNGRRPGGEGLVEPQVIPPLHGHQVTEPHVRQFVQDGIRAALVLVVRGLGRKDVLVTNCYASGVLHRTGVELRHEDLVIFAKGVGKAEVAVVEIKALFGLREQAFGIERIQQRRAAVNAQRHLKSLRRRALRVLRQRAGPRIRHAHIRARTQCNQVGRQRVIHRGTHGIARTRDGGVGNHRPVLRDLKAKRVRSLQVRLVKAGEDALGVGSFELGVEVGLTIHRVNEAVQALAGAGVTNLRHDFKLVRCYLQARQRNAVGRVISVGGQGSAVEADLEKLVTAQVNKCGASFLHPELHHGRGSKELLPGEVEGDVVVAYLQHVGALLGFLAGEVNRGHVGYSSFSVP